MAVMAVVPVPHRSSIAATTVEQFLADELTLVAAYEMALLEHRRKSLAVTPYEVVQCEKRLIGVLASIIERNLDRTLRRVNGEIA